VTAAVYTGFIVALLIIARLVNICRWLYRERGHTDPLTHLPNRQGFETIVGSHLKSGSPFGIVWIGLDGFRAINERSGYAGGDRVLKQIGPRIRRCLRPGDAVARFGGDQFLILLRGHDDIVAIADRILGAPILGNSGASAGVSLYPNHADAVPELLEMAETAMCEAKNRIRGGISFYEPRMASAEFRGAAVADLIRSALSDGHLRLVYQPVVNIACEIVRMEAFVRIEDPALGRIAPAVFVGVAEQTGLIHEMGAWILRHACGQIRRWRDAGLNVDMSLNLSPLQVASDELADRILAIVAEAGVPPSALVMEITGPVGPKGPLKRLRSAGIRISTQYRDEQTPLFDGIRIKAPFKMPAKRPAHLTVIAQDIEEPQQLDQAQAAGCHLFQGYQIAPPLEPEDATEILRTGLFAGAGRLVNGKLVGG